MSLRSLMLALVGVCLASGVALAQLSYPDLYRSLALPELPKATLEDTGRQTTSLRDGLALTLSTTLTVDEAAQYYRDAMLKLGWEETPSRGLPPGMPMARREFKKDGLTYSLTITRLPEATQVRITLVEL